MEKDMVLTKIEVPGTNEQDKGVYSLIQSHIYQLCFGLVQEKTGNVIASFSGQQVGETDLYRFERVHPPETISPVITSDDKAIWKALAILNSQDDIETIRAHGVYAYQ